MTSFKHYLVRGWDFPRLQLAVTGCMLIAVNIAIYLLTLSIASMICLLVTLSCIIWQIWWIIPYTKLHSKEVQTSAAVQTHHCELSIMSANVLQPNKNYQGLINLVKKHGPDILVTLETDQVWEKNLTTLEAQLPYTVKCPLDNLYGMHVYSAIDFDKFDVQFLIEDDVPSVHCHIRLNGQPVRLHFMHPAPPSPNENKTSLERDKELILLAKSVAEHDVPTVVAGDLNDVAWSPTTRLFRKISGLLDPRIGRGMFNTFHTHYWFARWPLDHLFHSHHFTLKRIQRLPSIGSDHFPLLTSLVYHPQQNSNAEGVGADRKDHENADELLDENEKGK